MTAAELLLLAVLAFNATIVLSIVVGIYLVAKTSDSADASAPPARTYDAALMQRQISKLQRVASQTDAAGTPSKPQNIVFFTGQSATIGEPNGNRRFWPIDGAPNLCTGKCNQGRNCTCSGQSKVQL